MSGTSDQPDEGRAEAGRASARSVADGDSSVEDPDGQSELQTQCSAQMHSPDRKILGKFSSRWGGMVCEEPPDTGACFRAIETHGHCTLFWQETSCAWWCEEPAQVDVGEVTISGFSPSPLALERRPSGSYDGLGSEWTAPAGTTLVLKASGGDIDPFEIQATAVGELVVQQEGVVVEPGRGVALDWIPADVGPGLEVPLCIEIKLWVSDRTSIRCTVEDSGHFEVPEALVTAALARATLDRTLRLSRTSEGSVSFEQGEIVFRETVTEERTVDIPSVISCRLESCPEGMACGKDWVCRPEGVRGPEG